MPEMLFGNTLLVCKIKNINQDIGYFCAILSPIAIEEFFDSTVTEPKPQN